MLGRYAITAAMVAALLCGGGSVCRAERPDPAEARLQAALAKSLPRDARVGICARRLSDGREIFAHNGNALFELASNTKLFTTAAALWRLGKDYEFTTTLIANGPIENGVLKGDLVVVGGGDPSLSARGGGEMMAVPRAMAAAVVKAGVREIAGDVVMDDRLFDREWRAPGWPPGEHLWWYAAPVSAISFNDNCLDVRVAGGATPGRPAILSCQPPLDVFRIDNRCTTASGNAASAVEFERKGATLVVSGRIRQNDARTESIAVDSPPMFFSAALRSALAGAAVTVRGQNRLARSGEKSVQEAQTLMVWRSKLSDAVAVANRRSQNFYAEQILKVMGAADSGVGTFASGAAVVGKFAKTAGFPDGVVRTVDGCGLSLGNQATPQAVVALLEIAHRSNFSDEFYESLAVNGDGDTTLKGRMTEKGMLGRVHAKTGTIKSGGIRTLSGYVEAADNEVYAFSILSNNFKPARLDSIFTLEDAICRALAGVK